jgi:ketosteroid isomerase-like protein
MGGPTLAKPLRGMMPPARAAEAVIAAIAHREPPALLAELAPDVEFFGPEVRMARGIDEVTRWLGSLGHTYPGYEFVSRKVLVAGNLAAVDCVLTSSRLGDLRLMGVDLPAREASISQPMGIVLRSDEAGVAELHVYYDQLRILETLGIFGDVAPAGTIDWPSGGAHQTQVDPGFPATMYGLWNQADLAGLAAMHDADCEYITPIGEYRGRPAVAEYIDGFVAAFSRVSLRSTGDIIDGDMVATRWDLRATHSGPLELPTGSIPATGRAFTLHGVNLMEVQSGRIRRYRAYFDRFEMLADLGLLPE